MPLDFPLPINDQRIIEKTDFDVLNAISFVGLGPDPIQNSIVSSATPVINTDATDFFTITTLGTAITGVTITGKAPGRKLIIRIKDDGTARGITWGSSFASRGATLPTTTVLGKYMYCGFIYNEVDGVWDLVALSKEA